MRAARSARTLWASASGTGQRVDGGQRAFFATTITTTLSRLLVPASSWKEISPPHVSAGQLPTDYTAKLMHRRHGNVGSLWPSALPVCLLQGPSLTSSRCGQRTATLGTFSGYSNIATPLSSSGCKGATAEVTLGEDSQTQESELWTVLYRSKHIRLFRALVRLKLAHAVLASGLVAGVGVVLPTVYATSPLTSVLVGTSVIGGSAVVLWSLLYYQKRYVGA